jgi:precorrin-6x reductase
MRNIVVFGGTKEGREIAQKISEKGVYVSYLVATDYGKEVVLCPNENMNINTGRMTKDDMCLFLGERNYFAVIDATHPYAVEVSQNIKEACAQTGNKYIRFLREESHIKDVIYVNSIEEACNIADDGNVLASTGSKEIHKYKALKDYKNRLYARVLPYEKSVCDCLNAGIDKEHIIESFGAVSKEENIKTIKKYSIKTLITKDGGKTGGFYEKYEAAKETGIKFIAIKRPVVETGYTFDEVIDMAMEGV